MNRNQFKFPGLLLFVLVILNSCNDSGEDTDPCLNGPTVTVDETISSIEGQANGEITASATGGKSPYMYSIDGSIFQSSGTFTSLEANDYTVTVKDANDCTSSATTTVDEIVAVSYADQIRPIIDADCQKSPCHGTNGGIPSWETYDDVKAGAARIKARTGNKTMPPAGPLSDANIKLIADWVDQGAEEN